VIPFYICLSITFCFLGCFYLNVKGKNALSPFLAITTAASAIVLTAYVIKADVGLHYLLFPILGLTAFTLPANNKPLIIGTMVFVLTCAFSILYLDLAKYGNYELKGLEAEIMHFSVFGVTGFIFVFKILINLDEMDKRFNSYLENQSKIEGQTRMSDLGRLMAGIAHEINNPLAVIKGSASFCLKRIDKNQIDPERTKKELTRISSHVERVVKIIEGLRFVSRDGSQDPMEPYSINETIREAYELCRYKLQEKGVQSNLVPLHSDETKCAIKLVQIEQVVFSIVSNAIDAIEEQTDKKIDIKMSESNSSVFIRISDNGPGVPKQIRSEVIKPFFTTKPVGKGTGLGLSVAVEILEKHKGSLTIEDSLDGASFLIELPKASEDSSLPTVA
jgi:signal transduction histidine kinase